MDVVDLSLNRSLSLAPSSLLLGVFGLRFESDWLHGADELRGWGLCHINLDGGGKLLNKGRLVINEMVSKSRIENEGTMLITGSDQVVNLAIEDGSLENNAYLKLDQWVTLNMNTPANENILFDNRGTMELEGTEGGNEEKVARIVALKDSLSFRNHHGVSCTREAKLG